jgi:hypothetical protein
VVALGSPKISSIGSSVGVNCTEINLNVCGALSSHSLSLQEENKHNPMMRVAKSLFIVFEF